MDFSWIIYVVCVLVWTPIIWRLLARARMFVARCLHRLATWLQRTASTDTNSAAATSPYTSGHITQERRSGSVEPATADARLRGGSDPRPLRHVVLVDLEGVEYIVRMPNVPFEYVTVQAMAEGKSVRFTETREMLLREGYALPVYRQEKP